MSANSKKHCYTVTIRRAENLPGLRYHVLAESKAQARAHVANTMIEVERTDPIDLLDLRRDQVIDATETPAPAETQEPLPLPEPEAADNSPGGVRTEPAEPTAAEALETPR